jgi:hypothetical protein
MKHATTLARLTLLLSMTFFFAGCGETVSGPPTGGGTVTQPPLGPEIMVVHPDGTLSWMRPPSDWGMPAAGAAGGTGSGGSNGPNRQSVSAEIKEADGGTIQCGRFFLKVPPGALDGDGTITMSAVDSTIQIVDIEISPASLNGFRQPVSLALCTTGLNVGPDSLTMYFYDPVDKKWLDMGALTSLDQDSTFIGQPYPANMQGVAISIDHFSRYGGGKAGW